MALAHIEILDYQPGILRCKIDIGKNKYYQILTGENEQVINGVKGIETIKNTSRILGPLSKEELGRKDISIPQGGFDKRNNRLQLRSFMDKNNRGVAVSDVVYVVSQHTANPNNSYLSVSKNIYMRQETNNGNISSYNTSFSLQENKMSNAQFLSGLLPMLTGAVKNLWPGLVKNAPNFIGSLLAASAKPVITTGVTTNGTAAPQVSADALMQLLNSPEVSALLQNLLKQTLNGGSAAAAPVVAKSLQQQLTSKYSEAKIAPALLAALPALMPLLQQILSPETIGKVLDQPQKMIGAVTDGIVKLGELGIASHEQDLQHLRALNPGTGPSVDSLLESMSLAITENAKLIPYKIIKSVKIKFDKVQTIDCAGKNCLVYSYGGRITIPVQIDTPKPIANCLLQLSIKDVQTSKILIIRNFKFKTANDIPLAYPSLEPADYEKLNSNTDYLVGMSLVFKNKTRENIGVYASEVIHFTNSHLFASIKSKGEVVPLNDIQVHRAFWHKVWETKFSKEKNRTKIHIKYYCYLTAENAGVGKMETLLKPVKSDDTYETSMLMKTGIKINIADLNKLIPSISKYGVLDENQLKAISATDFLSSYNTMAQDVIKMNGFDNELAMLWVFPELIFHEILLKKINKVNEFGMVTELADDVVRFPIPNSLYFIGTKNSKK